VTTGDADPVIDVLFEAQGEDVVSGRARPKTETELAQSSSAIAAELRRELAKLERGFKDVEFTIEDGRLWILQGRSTKRTPGADCGRFRTGRSHSPAKGVAAIE
jgi:pyruvate,orthophosphate dikinase